MNTTKPPLVFPPVMITTLADEGRHTMPAEATTVGDQLRASLLQSRLVPVLALVGALVRHEFQGEPLSPIVKDVAVAWGTVATSLLDDSAISAMERQTITAAAKRFLEACAGVQQS
jgi:hypothetical protein